MGVMKKLKDLLPDVSADMPSDVAVSGVSVDSRLVRPGHLFVALPGVHHDGHDHAADAVRAGAAAVLAQRPLSVPAPVVVVPSTSLVLSEVAARFFDHPSRGMDVVGVTGTNGKTTITYLLENIWRLENVPGGVIGTIEYRWPGHVEKAVNTTPHALDVQRLLADMKLHGVGRAVMETSSHALALGRVADVSFTVGIFSNLTQDHLDFHQDMERYFLSKARLFRQLNASPRPRKRAVLNADDPWVARLRDHVSVPLWTYGIESRADFRAEGVGLSADGCRFRIVTPEGDRPVYLGLVGRYNVYNALAAVSGALALGTPLETAVRGVETMTGVPGRLERVTEHPAGSPAPSRLPFSVFVDFAHTEDALRNVLTALRPLTKGRLRVLFGCGGDRDRTKRPKMGECAARLADDVVISSDNPRSEDPGAIAEEVAAGARRAPGRPCTVIVERKEAIHAFLSSSKEGDVALLAGKGHETYQIFKDRTEDFDDRQVARSALSRLAERGDYGTLP